MIISVNLNWKYTVFCTVLLFSALIYFAVISTKRNYDNVNLCTLPKESHKDLAFSDCYSWQRHRKKQKNYLNHTSIWFLGNLIIHSN